MPPPSGPPPVELTEPPTVFPMERGRSGDLVNSINTEWVRFRATANFRATPGQAQIDDWSIGFVQRILIISSFHCYRRLSGPATEPGSYPLEDGPVLVVRKSLPQSGRYPFDGEEWRDLRWARPPIISAGVSFPVSVTMIDRPRIRQRGFLTRTFPDGRSGDVGIHSSFAWTQFYITVAARHNPSNLMYPFWHLRWYIKARYFHVRHFNTHFESHRDDSLFRYGVISSLRSVHDMGAHGYVSGRGSDEVPANDAQRTSEEWMASCPEP